jgi:hypothetical protein
MTPNEPTVNTPRHLAALTLAAAGVPIFPCLPGAKQPATKHGFTDATTDLAQIDAWWSAADYNIGLKPSGLGLVAIDLDLTKPDGVSPAVLAMLPETRTHMTPHGGQHRFYKSAETFGNAVLAVNVDIRSKGGYILWPPSIIDGVAYTVADAREAEPLPENVAAQMRGKAAGPGEPSDDIGLDMDPEGARAFCARLTGKDYDRYALAAALVRNFGLSDVTATALCEEYGLRTWPTNSETTWQTTLHNARKYGKGQLGEGVAFSPPEGDDRADTFDAALENEQQREIDAILARVQIDAETVEIEATPDEAAIEELQPLSEGKSGWEIIQMVLARVPKPRLRLFRSRKEAMNRPPPVMLVDKIIPAGKLILPYGATGEGKTYFALEIATAIAMRRPAFGEFKINAPGDSGVVVIFAGEDCDMLDKSRLVAIEHHYVRSLEGLVFTTDLAIPLTDRSLFQRYRDELKLIQDITGKPIDLIVNDTLGRSIHGLKPNDQETGQIFTAGMEGLIQEFNTTILCVAHQPKSDSGTISGTQVFLDNAPVTPHIVGTKLGGQLSKFRVTMEPKFRVGAPPKPFTAVARTVPLPTPVNGSHSDLIFTTEPGSGQGFAGSEVRTAILAALPKDGTKMHIQCVCDATGLTKDTIGRHVRGMRAGGKMKVKSDCADLVVTDVDGLPPDQTRDWYLRKEVE